MILEITAEVNGGLCGPCKSSRDAENWEKTKEYYRNHPPQSMEEVDQIVSQTESQRQEPLQMYLSRLVMEKSISWNGNFKKREFTENLKKAVLEHQEEPETLAMKFLCLAEPALYVSASLTSGVKKLPRPYREIMAVYQLWGMMTSDGLSSYFENTNQSFDNEVDLGLKLLKKENLVRLVARARHDFKEYDEETANIEAGYEDLIYENLDEFESNFLAPFLIAQATKKK